MKTLLLVTALVAASISGPALAEPARSVATVSTAGLDLGSAAGIRSLDLRILHAASALCGTPSPADGRGLIKLRQCRAEARANALADRSRAIEFARSRDAVQIASNR